MASVEDDMDSLFEGMVLFNPSEISTDHDHQQQHQPPPSPPLQSAPAPDAADDYLLSSTASVAQPLDESLFSDLTLITPLQEPLPDLQPFSPASTAPEIPGSGSAPSVASASSPATRQVSTRKKKRAGLRIGYGRDSPIFDDSNLSLPHSFSGDVQTPPPPSNDEIRSSVPSTPVVQEAQLANHSTGTAVGDDFCNQTSEVVGCTDGITSTSPDDVAADEQLPAVREDLDAKKDLNFANEIELGFEQIKDQISQKLKHAKDFVASVSAARKDSIRRRRKVAEDLSLASMKHRELEKELEDACEAEDFEVAERVSVSLASAENEKEILTNSLRVAETACDDVDLKMQEALERQIEAEEECASMLQLFALDASSNADSVLKNAEATNSMEMEVWFSASEALEVKKMGLEIESHFVEEAQSCLNKSIDDLVTDDKRERELLCQKREVLMEDLEKLLALVKKKEVEIAETNINIENINKRITNVASSFEEVQLRIDAKHDELHLGLSQVEVDSKSLWRKKKDMDDFLSEEEGRGAKVRDLGQISADEATMYKEMIALRRSLMHCILKTREHKLKLAKSEEELLQVVQMLKQEISAARASLQELSAMKSSIQQEIECTNQRILFIEKRVPELEAEKKVAATARNFKEAARIAGEAKTLSIEKEAAQIKMEGTKLGLGKLEKEIRDIIEKLESTEVQISAKEKELAMARFERLLLIAGTARSERLAALELGDSQEADALLAEAEAADIDIKKLQPLYNFREEDFANLPRNFVSMELVSSLGGEQLTELAASAHISGS